MNETKRPNDTEHEPRPEEPASGPDAGRPGDDAADATAPDPRDEEISRLKDLLLRKAAEFENYKKRTESEMAGIIRLANENVILSILPVVDDLERSLKAARTAQDLTSFHKGVELIHQKMLRLLESQGVTPLETVGREFDVHFHDAMMQVPTADAPPHTIIDEVERGYSMNGKVIRHAKVVVATQPEETSDTPGSAGRNDQEGSGT